MPGGVDEQVPIERSPLEQLAQGLRIQPIETLSAHLVGFDEAGVEEDPQVLRNRWLSHVKWSSEFVD
jgi:hypothetical protein